MTTKYLTGAYPSGYTVAKYTYSIDIESTASIGGTGIDGRFAKFALQITNDGTIDATSGYGNGILAFGAGGNIVNGMSNPPLSLRESRMG